MNISRLFLITLLLSIVILCMSDTTSFEKKKKRRRRLKRLRNQNRKTDKSNNGLDNIQLSEDQVNIDDITVELDKTQRRLLRRKYRKQNKKLLAESMLLNNKKRRNRRNRRKHHKIHRQDLSNFDSIPAMIPDGESIGELDPSPVMGKTKRKLHRKRSHLSGDLRTSKRLRRRDRFVHPPTRHHTYIPRGIPVGEALVPPLCPPSVGLLTRETCMVPSCTTHRECRHGLACCYNGCVHTCTTPMDRPAVIDWFEDTGDIKPIFDVADKMPILPDIYKESPAFATGVDTVRLAGGCLVSATQYEQLKNFMEGPNIDGCKCKGEEVECKVKQPGTER